MKVKMLPHISSFRNEESGIRRVVEAYSRYLPEYGVELVDPKSEDFDLGISHAGYISNPDVLICHGLYWTGDYPAERWEYFVNRDVIKAIRFSREITVPSRWVAETFQRDMHFSPTVLPHGIEWEQWQHKEANQGYILWNKNRVGDVCDPMPVGILARRLPDYKFVTTFLPSIDSGNIVKIGLQPNHVMKRIIQGAGIYLSTTKETFGIGALEALASGVPVLGFAHGGNLDTVIHGVNGYLATPGDYDDLEKGLEYCVKFRTTLGGNAHELSKQFTWRNAVEILYTVLERAKIPQKPSVAVIIPSYNYGDRVGRAIESCLAQSFPLLENIVVVDDGSDDEGKTKQVVNSYTEKDKRVKYIHQVNAGVANARNTGIDAVFTKYICCLDADDAITPNFLDTCVKALEADTSLGVAYTKLAWIKNDGTNGISTWPDEYRFDEQLQRRNQIPTCCVFRRKMWERLYGYRQRYAPKGAGAEDAEFWLRSGAYGFGAKLVTKDALFLYSVGTGRVSGDPSYREVDWTQLHPWTKDNNHPFASLASTRTVSHPVRQYDNPLVSVVVPVGKGHEKEIVNVLDALESQTFRNWEVVIVWDVPIFETQNTKERVVQHEIQRILTAFPFIKSIELHPFETFLVKKYKPYGAGYARNRGVDEARGSFIVFNDADDWLYPKALETMLEKWTHEEAVIYSDYVGKAYVAYEEAVKKQDRLLYYDDKTQEAVIKYSSFDYDCARAIAQPDQSMYIWCLVTCLFPKAWHYEIGGFDENMTSWEDWDYWIRIARTGKCFARIAEPLVVYRFYTGGRRDSGVQNAEILIKYMLEKYEGANMMPCRSCGHSNRQEPGVMVQQSQNVSHQESKIMNITDDDLVMILYNSQNIGQHKVMGAATGKNYGYHGGGERFYVMRADVALQKDLFVPIQEVNAVAPVVEHKAETPPPAPIDSATILKIKNFLQSSGAQEKTNTVSGMNTTKESTESAEDLGQTFVFSNLEETTVDKVPGVTPSIAAQLNAEGIHTAKDLLSYSAADLVKIKGIGEKRAEIIMSYITERTEVEKGTPSK